MADLAPLRWPHSGFVSAIRWRLNEWLTRHPSLLNRFEARVTIFDAFGAPGDTLLTAIVISELKQCYPRLRVNCLTPNPTLLEHDTCIDSINEPEDYLSVWHWYLDIVDRKDAEENVLAGTLRRFGVEMYDYKARVHLTKAEIAWGREQLGDCVKPVISFNTRSKEAVKNWPAASWRGLVERLRSGFDLVHLGDDSEPIFDGVRRFAGRTGLRQSMALVSQAELHIGPDSFLMHVANGLDVPSVIIFGGSRTPANVGYAENRNLFVPMPCGPCWIHQSRGEQCEHGVACLGQISVDEVYAAVLDLRQRTIEQPKVDAAVPVANSAELLPAVLASIRAQTVPVGDILVLDDGSSDESASLARECGARVVSHRQNLGRGAARAAILAETTSPLIFMCDSSLAASRDFLSLALPLFDDPKVAAVFGRVMQASARGAADRWRNRHLFRSAHSAFTNNSALLATGACVLRRSAVIEVGGFNPRMRSGEDADLGRRLLAAGWKVVADGKLRAKSLRQDSARAVLQRFARWNSPEGLSPRRFLKQLAYAVKVMARDDLRARDPAAAMLSLAAPFFQIRAR